MDRERSPTGSGGTGRDRVSGGTISSGTLAGHFVRGSLWVLSGSAAVQLLSFAAQIALGWLLAPEEFGLYAIVLGLFAVASVFRDGGSTAVLIQQQARRPELTGTVFWYALGANVAAATLLLASAIPAARIYGAPELAGLVAVAALTLPLGTPGSVLTARLRADLRFGAVVRIRTASAVVRYGLAVLLASRGMGAMSLVAAMPVAALVESAMALAHSRHTPLRTRPKFADWVRLLRDSRWLVVAAASVAAIDLGFGLTLGLVVPVATLGLLFFANQIVLQIGTLLCGGMDSTLFPTLTKLADQPERMGEAIKRTFLHAAPIAAVASFGLCLLVAPVEHILWQGRWAAAVPAAQVLAALYPMNLAMALTMSAQRASGRFRDLGRMSAVVAIWVLSIGLLGGLLTGTATGTASAIGAAMLTGSAWYTRVGLLRVGVGSIDAVRSFGLAWLAGAGGAGVALLLGTLAAQGGWGPAVQSGVAACGFIGTFTLAWRLFAPDAYHVALRTLRSLGSVAFS